jgi:hypothetical protein
MQLAHSKVVGVPLSVFALEDSDPLFSNLYPVDFGKGKNRAIKGNRTAQFEDFILGLGGSIPRAAINSSALYHGVD